ncbi:MAG: ABC transporter ATP-binding protein [Erysipelotrichaceae bacterium]|nr:ABC transporter ATP-binding protein [Erysipelotrichaceae bacterium]
MKLVVEDFSKSYGDHVVFENVNIEFEEGKIYGLLGRNGSGKTTFFNCLDALVKYQKGNFYIVDDDGNRVSLDSGNLGFVFTEPMLPSFLTGREFIRTYMEINNIDEIDKIDDYFKMIYLAQEDADKLINDYSAGMKNKIQLLLILISKPKIILLDEPLSTFDVIVAADVKQMLKDLKEGHILVFSTHILELAKSICDEIVIINNHQIEKVDSSILESEEFEKNIVELLRNE